jgi:exopolysaccharide biosynthesis polyprenyl glycosylphosphotransferase
MIAVFLAAAVVVFRQSQSVGVINLFSMRIKIQNFLVFCVLLLVWHYTVRLAGLYDSRRLASRSREIMEIVKATSFGFVAVLLAAIALRITLMTPLFLAVFWVGITCSTIISRVLLRTVLAVVRKRGRNLRNVLIVGTNRRALDVARTLTSSPEAGYRITGFVDQHWQGADEVCRNGYTVVSDIDGFPQYLRGTVVDEVIMALPFRSMHDRASRVAAVCEEQGITMRVLPCLFDLKRARFAADDSESGPLVMPSTTFQDDWPLIVKRFVDVALSTICLIALSPLLLLIAVLIKCTSPGPVLFLQKRIGLNKRPFTLFKFRTMVVDAERRMAELEHMNEASGPVFKIAFDPRITPIGRLLRKTSIDELPQLVNVLMGDMSLVGPRPLPARDYNGFIEDWPRRRFSVKPGITCLWQVCGRSAIPFEQWMELDLQYIDKWSLWLDAEILLRTIPAVLRGSGAV